MPGKRVKVGARSSLSPGAGMCVELEGRKLAIFDVGGTLHAIDDDCTHVGGSLSEGELDGGVVTCPWHGAKFDLATGKPLCPPASRPVRTYPVGVEGAEIWVELD